MSKGPCALFDANLSLGPVVAARAMRLAIEKAKEFGIGLVGVYQANSFSSAKYYPLMAVEEGMIGIVRTNTGPMMPPHGGSTATVGNNPISIAAPAGGEYPFVYDIACAIAREKIWKAQAENQPIPDDWAIGPDGNPTTDPNAALYGGALLPFGGYKAFGLALSNEVLTSVLFGGAVFCGGAGAFRPYETRYNASHFFQAIDISAFTPLDDFKARMDEMMRKVKSSKLRPGFDRVFLPGERGFTEMEKRKVDGIPIEVETLRELKEWADELKVPALQ
jgi:LDH2 family malate/lactate/ureidoglycolate dehydrogenase